jgi:hypothetical protein
MPRQLKNVVVHEISSVDAGASGDRTGRGRARVVLRKRQEDTTTMSELSVADEVNNIMKKLTDHGVPFDQAATVAHRTETAFKNGTVRKNDVDPCDTERDERLDKLWKLTTKLYKLGGFKSLNAALDAAMRFNVHDVDQAPISP